MATEQDWAAYADQAVLNATDTILARTSAGAGVEVPGSALVRKRSDGHVYVPYGGSGAQEFILSLDPGSNGFNTRDTQIRAGNNGSNQTYLDFYTSNAAAPAQRMHIDYAGNVNIGAASATGGGGIRYFDVYNTENTNGSSAVDIRLVTQNVAGTSPVSVDIIKYKNGAFVINNTESNAAAYFALGVGGEKMRIDSSGNVGVGKTPSYRLDVAGTLNVDLGDLRIGRQTDAWGYIIRPNVSGYKNLRFAVDGGGALDTVEVNTVAFRPQADNGTTLGTSGQRWSVVYAATGTINTSDEREKDWRGGATEAEIQAARRIIAELGFYQWKDAVEAKGAEDARYHFGVRAQRVWAIMAEEGLVDPIGEDGRPGKTPYAFLCFDEWEDEFEDEMETVTREEQVPAKVMSASILGTDGQPATKVEYQTVTHEERVPTGKKLLVRPAGNRFGVRTDQLTLFLIAAQEARLAALEDLRAAA